MILAKLKSARRNESKRRTVLTCSLKYHALNFKEATWSSSDFWWLVQFKLEFAQNLAVWHEAACGEEKKFLPSRKLSFMHLQFCMENKIP